LPDVLVEAASPCAMQSASIVTRKEPLRGAHVATLPTHHEPMQYATATPRLNV
jgi:hypothetical protein